MRGRHISLKAAERINIGGVSGPVILAMVMSLDVAVGADVVQDAAQVICIISTKSPLCQAYGRFEFFYAKSVSGVAHCTLLVPFLP